MQMPRLLEEASAQPHHFLCTAWTVLICSVRSCAKWAQKQTDPPRIYFCCFSDLKGSPKDQPSSRTQGRKEEEQSLPAEASCQFASDILKNEISFSQHKLMLLSKKCFSPPFCHCLAAYIHSCAQAKICRTIQQIFGETYTLSQLLTYFTKIISLTKFMTQLQKHLCQQK